MRSRTPSEAEIEALIDADILAEIGDPMPVPKVATLVYVPLLLIGVAASVFWTGTIPGARWQPTPLGEDILLGLAVGLALVASTFFLTKCLRPFQELAQEFRRVFGSIPVRSVILLALLSGLAEEVVFRGVLQPLIGYVATSLLFGAVHFVPSFVFLPWTLFAFGAGFLFGWMFEDRGSLTAPMVAHVTVNALNLLLIVRFAPEPPARPLRRRT